MKFSFHGIVGVDIDDAYPWFDTLFIRTMVTSQNTAAYADSRKFIKIRYKHKLEAMKSKHIDKSVHLAANAFIDTEYGCQLTWENENSIVIHTSSECNEWLLICLQIMFLSEGYSLIHAAAFYRDGKTLLMPARANVGKTACVAGLVRNEGWKLLGDDMVIINGQGKVLSFLKEFVIYPYHKAFYPDVFAGGKGPAAPISLNRFLTNLVPFVKPVLRTMPSLLAFARKHNPQSKCISPYQLFSAGQLIEQADITDVIWMDRSLSKEVSAAEAVPQTIASKAAATSILDIVKDRSRMMLALCGAAFIDFNQFYVETYNIFNDAFSHARIYELDVPEDFSLDKLYKALIQFLHKIC